MKTGRAAGLFLLCVVSNYTAILAANSASLAPAISVPLSDSEAEYGGVNPPSGYVSFCKRSPDACPTTIVPIGGLALTPDHWGMLTEVNTTVNRSITSVSDQQLYGQPEFWTYPTRSGDCEDYVLLKQKLLLELGFPTGSLLITVVRDENQDGHAVLTVTTTSGDYILDNRRDLVLPWSRVGYTFVKRQSARNPGIWVSLAEDGKLHAEYASAAPADAASD